jgi:hypothetical protein
VGVNGTTSEVRNSLVAFKLLVVTVFFFATAGRVMANPSPPDLPEDPSRLLASRVDHYARLNGSRVYASIPRSDHLEDGFQDITYTQLAGAIDQASWWLDTHLGKEHERFECFAYFGPRDLRYVALIIAGIKTGRMARITQSFKAR